MVRGQHNGAQEESNYHYLGTLLRNTLTKVKEECPRTVLAAIVPRKMHARVPLA